MNCPLVVNHEISICTNHHGLGFYREEGAIKNAFRVTELVPKTWKTLVGYVIPS
jgi:hypothetical protein